MSTYIDISCLEKSVKTVRTFGYTLPNHTTILRTNERAPFGTIKDQLKQKIVDKINPIKMKRKTNGDTSLRVIFSRMIFFSLSAV